MVSDTYPNKIKRPAIWACSAFMAGILAGVWAAKHDFFNEIIFMLLAVYAVVVVTFLLKRVAPTAVICILFFTVAVVYSFFVYSDRFVQKDLSGKEYNITATVLDYDKTDNDSIRYEVDCVQIDSVRLDTHILVTLKNSTNLLNPGDKIEFTSEIYKPSAARNSMVFDYSEYLADKRIYYTVYTDYENVSVTPYENTKGALRYDINRFKRNTLKLCSEYLDSEALGIVYAITSGDTVYIDDEVYEKYRITGTAHVLAISGLHVGFIVLFLSFVTKRLRKYSPLYTAVNVAAVWVYIIFSGMSVSAVRAGIFFTMFSVGKMLKLRCNVTNIAFITAFIMLAVNPMSLFSVSFRLSFAAVLSIGILSPAMSDAISKRIKIIPRDAINTFSAVVCAAIGIMPIIAYHYNTLSVVSTLVNLIIVPLFSYIVLFSFALMLAVNIHIHFIASAFSVIITGLVRITDVILDFASSFKYSSITVASPDAVLIIAFVVAVVILSVEKPAPIKKKLIPLCCCLFVIAADIFIPYTGIDNTYTASFIDVGQAECSLIVTPHNKTVMIDAGTSYGSSNTAEYTIIPYLLKHGNTKIDYLVLSHAHSDHIGEAEYIIDHINVKNIIYSCPDENTGFDAIKDAAQRNGTNMINMYYTQSVQVDSTTYINKVCDYYESDDANAQSLVVEVACSKNNILFAGDMPSKGLNTMQCSDNILIYKASHHGSDSALSDTINEAAPLYTVIFTKSGNSYGLPDENALDVYRSYSNVLLTEECGEIKFTFNDGYVKVFRYIV